MKSSKHITTRWGCILFALLLTIALFPAGAGSAQGDDPVTIISHIKQFENELRSGPRDGSYFGYVKGSIPILISAPHGARHYRTRKNFWKAEDAYTSAIALELGRLTGAHVLYLRHKAPEDPNNDLHTKYKDFLAGVARGSGIKFIIDLHGAGADRPFKIDIGVLDDRVERSSCPKLHAMIENAFRNFEEHPFNRRFRAKDPGTVTYFARKTLGIEAAQIEINAQYRIPDCSANEQNLLELVTHLQSLIGEINGKVQCSEFRVQS